LTCAGCAAACIDASPGLAIGVGGNPARFRVLYGESLASWDWRIDSVGGMFRP
jgi:hypothetical protein